MTNCFAILANVQTFSWFWNDRSYKCLLIFTRLTLPIDLDCLCTKKFYCTSIMLPRHHKIFNLFKVSNNHTITYKWFCIQFLKYDKNTANLAIFFGHKISRRSKFLAICDKIFIILQILVSLLWTQVTYRILTNKSSYMVSNYSRLSTVFVNGRHYCAHTRTQYSLMRNKF